MKPRSLVLLGLIALVGCRTMPAGKMEEELARVEQAIKARAGRFNEALSTGNPELIVSLYAHDAFFLLPDTVEMRKTDLRAFFAGYLALNPTIETVTEYLSIASSLEMAYEVGTYNQEYDTPNGRVVERARYLNVWKKEGGSWYIGAEAFVPSGTPLESVLSGDFQASDSALYGLPDSSTAVIRALVGGEER